MAATKRERTANFSASEVEVLVSEVEKCRDILFSAFSSTLDNQKKQTAWDSVTQKVNSVSIHGRSKDQIKKKWQDIQSAAKKKECKRLRECKQTGGSLPPPDLSELDRKVVSLIPKQLIEGIPGGIDTFSLEVSPTPAVFCDITQSINDTVEVEVYQPTPSTSSDSGQNIMDTDQDTELPVNKDSKIRCLQDHKQKRILESKRSLVQDSSKTTDINSKILKIEEEKLCLKKRKLQIMEELLTIEKEKLKLMASQNQPSHISTSPFSYSCSLLSPIIKLDE